MSRFWKFYFGLFKVLCDRPIIRPIFKKERKKKEEKNFWCTHDWLINITLNLPIFRIYLVDVKLRLAFGFTSFHKINPLVQLAPYSYTLTSLEAGWTFGVHDQILKVVWTWKAIIQSNVLLEKQKFASTHKYVKIINKVS